MMDNARMYETYDDRNERQVKTTLERHPDHYAKAGAKGGKAAAKKRDKDFYSMMGKKSAEKRREGKKDGSKRA